MKKQSALFLLVTSFMMFACSSDAIVAPEEQLPTLSGDKEIPYALQSELDDLRLHNDDVIDYEVARKAALVDMLSFTEEFSELNPGQPYSLSDKPVIIYDVSGKPKFYEFLVSDVSGTCFATITTFARKEVNTFSACVLPYVRSYELPNSQVYTPVYPEVSSEADMRSMPESNPLSQTSDILTDEEIDDFWNKVDVNRDLFEVSDDDIVSNKSASLRATKYYTIPRFDEDKLKRTSFSGWCGPAAMAWVYRGFYTHYQGDKIPLHGDYSNTYNPSKYYMYTNGENRNTSSISADCPLIKDIEEKSRTLSGIIKGATMPDDFDRTVAELFPGFHIDRHKGTIKGAPRRAIQRGNPVYMVVVTGDVQLHYIIGFGTKDKYGWFGIHTDSWILVTDNGTQISKHNYLPYYRSSNFFNFSNKYTHMGEFVQP